AVIVAEFLARLDPAQRKDVDALLPDLDLAVRPAGVIDVAGGVRARLAVDGLLLGHFEQIPAAAGVFFLLADAAAGVFDDARALLDRPEGVKAETGARAPDLEVERVPIETLLLHRTIGCHGNRVFSSRRTSLSQAGS